MNYHEDYEDNEIIALMWWHKMKMSYDLKQQRPRRQRLTQEAYIFVNSNLANKIQLQKHALYCSNIILINNDMINKLHNGYIVECITNFGLVNKRMQTSVSIFHSSVLYCMPMSREQFATYISLVLFI